MKRFIVAILTIAALANGSSITGAAQLEQKAAPPVAQKLLPQKQLPAQLAGQCTSPDRVAVTDFTINPSQPRQGQQVVISMTIKNTCNGPLNVPWRIETGTGNTANQILGASVQANVPAGASFTVTANWQATAGQRGLLGMADPENVFRENNQYRQNNYKDLAVNVPQVSADTQASGGTAQEMDTQLLEHVKAKNAGANFSGSRYDIGCGIDNFGGQAPQQGVSSSDGVRLYVNCTGLLGTTADFDLYSNFRLKNGWRIVRVDVEEGGSKGPRGWNWQTPAPQAGSDNPYVKIHTWAEAGGYANLTVKITIRGPRGTDPYQ